MKRFLFLLPTFLACVFSGHAAKVVKSDGMVTVSPDGGQARTVCLQVVGDGIVRVRATSADALPKKSASLMIVPQQGKPVFNVSETDEQVVVTTAKMKAVVGKRTGALSFYDSEGKTLLREAADGKKFWAYRVPDREIGVDVAKVPEKQRNGLTWQMVFDSPADEAFYGLGQHQSGELNMKGKNEDLFQYNTKVSVPFVISNKNYGILWDSYSYCRFGQAEDYVQLSRVFRLYDKEGREGCLPGIYTDKDGRQIVRQEDSIYYEYACPPKSELANRTDTGGIRNLPKGFNLDGAKVVYEGSIEPRPGSVKGDFQFILYYAGYVRVYIGGEEVVPEIWRTSWNPNAHKFTCHVPEGVRSQLRIEWQPDGGESYCGLRVAKPRSREEREQLSIWSEMAQDMDYYVIVGQSMDEVIGGYRTLTGHAPVYPKWALGYWQSRERYKTSQEIEDRKSVV